MKRLLLIFAVAFSVAADVRVAPFRFGLTDLSEVTVGLLPRDTAFAAITLRHAPSFRDVSTIRYTPTDVNGTLIPAAAIDLVVAPNMQSARVASAGRGALLGWTIDDTFYVASLSSDLHLGTPLKLGPSTASQVACNAARCLASWRDAPTGQMKGLMTDLACHELFRLDLRSDFTQILTDPNGFLLVGYDGVSRIDSSGAVTFTTPFPPHTFSIIGGDFDGAEYVLIFSPSNFEGGNHNTIATIDLQGRFSTPFLLDVPLSDRALLAWNGVEHFLVFDAVVNTFGVPFIPGVGVIVPTAPPSNLFVARLSAALELLSTPIQITMGLEPKVLGNVASNGTLFDVAYDDGATVYFANGQTFTPTNEPRLALLSPQTGVVSDQGVSVGPLSQKTPALATSDALRLAVWTERGSDDPSTLLRASRIAADGRRLDDTPIALDSAAAITLSRKSVAAIGDDFLVVFSKDQKPSAILVHGDGTHEAIALPYANGAPPQVVTNGRTWFIVAAQSFGMGVVRVARSGALLTPSVANIGPANVVDAASDGDHFAVLGTLVGAHAHTTLQIFDADFTRVDKNVDFGDLGTSPLIAGTDDGYVIVSRADVAFARRVSLGGEVVGAPVKLPIAGSVVDVQPYSEGWLVHAINFKEDDLVHLDRDTLAVLGTIVEPESVQAIAANSDGSVSALFADVLSENSLGIGVAQVLREIAPGHPRRHGAPR